MNKKTSHVFLIVLLLLVGCKSLISPTETGKISSSSLSFEDLSAPKSQIVKSFNVNNLENQFKREAEALISADKTDLADYYKDYLDSLRTKLLDSGSVKIKGYEDFLVNILSNQIKNDTIYIANLVTETKSKGTPLSFQYTGLKNDRFYFEIECLKMNALSELIYGGLDIEFVEGAEIRFQHTDLSKKDKIRGSFLILDDNPVIFNVTKSGFLKASLRVRIKKVLGSNLVVERTTDSIEEIKMVIKEVSDTLYHLIDEKQYTLAPRLDLTNVHRIEMPFIVEDLDNVIGWGFWVGLNKSDSESYSKLNELILEEPLKLFAKSELSSTASRFSLPQTPNENLKFKFSNHSNDTISFNSTETYRFFKSDILANKKKGQLSIINQSKIYDFKITVKTVAVNIQKSKILEKETTYKLDEYINLSLLK